MRRVSIYLIVGLLLFLSGCNNSIPKETPISDTYPSLIPPWTDGKVYYDETSTINVKLWDKFIIRYDYYHDLFPTFEESYDQSPIIVSLLEETGERTSDLQTGNGVHWFLFQVVHTGDISITLKHFTHQSDVVQDQKTFKIHVGFSLW